MKIPLCEHIFHINCLKKWLMDFQKCPVCESNIIRLPLGKQENISAHGLGVNEEGKHSGDGLSANSRSPRVEKDIEFKKIEPAESNIESSVDQRQ